MHPFISNQYLILIILLYLLRIGIGRRNPGQNAPRECFRVGSPNIYKSKLWQNASFHFKSIYYMIIIYDTFCYICYERRLADKIPGQNPHSTMLDKFSPHKNSTQVIFFFMCKLSHMKKYLLIKDNSTNENISNIGLYIT